MPILSLRTLVRLGGLVQAAAAFSPAVRVRLFGTASFVRVHPVGGILLTLGVLTAVIAMQSRVRWIAITGLLSFVLTSGMYVRILTAPSGTFFDPVLRRTVRPAWGFIPMFWGVLFGLGAAVGLLWIERAADRKAASSLPLQT